MPMALPRVLTAATLCAGACGSTNPFLDASGGERAFYINPVNAKQYESSISMASGSTSDSLRAMQRVPSAYWIDVKAKIKGTGTRSVEGILRDAASKSPPELVVLIWYDLPNRDCFAKASNGEICCTKKGDGTCDYSADGDCAEGIREYKTGYVDPFVSVLKRYQDRLPIVIVVEPDSLPNLATNLFHPGCGSTATQNAYKIGIKYSLQQLATETPSVAVYLDASHGGWLGWENSMEKFMKTLRGLDIPKIRGFATNVANYQPLGVQCPWCPDQGYRNAWCLNGRHKDDPCCRDPCDLLSQYNFGNNELNFAAGLVAAADAMLGMDAHVVIDTGRNGVGDHRQKCSSWCNPRGAGAGVPSTTKVANSSLVDAYFWLKTPGESDGCTEELPNGDRCPRFDYGCKSEDSLGSRDGEPRAPEAGHWFDYQVKELAKYSRFEQEAGSSSTGNCEEVAWGWQPGQSGGGESHQGGAGQHGHGKEEEEHLPEGLPAEEGEGEGHHGGPDAGEGEAGAVCSPAFGQCGGHHWTGPQCCEGECHCRREGEWYHQCEPPAGTHLCVRRLLDTASATGLSERSRVRDALGALGLQARAGRAGMLGAIAAAGAVALLAVLRVAAKARRDGGSRPLPGASLGDAESAGLLDAELRGVAHLK